jgi:putative sigma-54 modulation protein
MAMEMVFRGRHMEVRPDVRAYAEEKIGKAAKLLNHMVLRVEVELYHERNRSIEKGQIAEVTIHTKHPGPIIRAKEAATDMKAAIDLVSEKLERQALRVKGKLDRKHAGRAQAAPVADLEPIEDDESAGAIVKRKSYELKPMDQDEAILQLEMLGHDFFVFTSSDTDIVNVLYRRHDGDYGLIIPKTA